MAAIVVDGNSGRVIFAHGEHERRHPASVTKVMTLYLLFEQLEKGRLRLNSPLMISAHAASQAPSKLGLAPGESIEVEHAIKAVVTKSANDIAVAIAENIGGDEDSFAEMMTQKAHALGMSDTHFANASGLPNDEQITTAHDLSVLGRAIQDRFPRYYRYFSTHSFAYGGQMMRNHNHLLGRVEGMDGIKTGYTRASGFNLLTSVHRGGRHIVAVVLGGSTAGARDRYMEALIEDHIDSGASARTARAVTEEAPAERETRTIAEADQRDEPIQAVEREPTGKILAVEREPTGKIPARVAASEVRAYAESPALTPPASIPSVDRADRVRPAFVPGVQKQQAAAPEQKKSRHARAKEPATATQLAKDGSTSQATTRVARHESAAAATTPSTLRHADVVRPPHSGWMIQVGAADEPGKANDLLSAARTRLHGGAANARAFTEKVQKGKETLWRARFAGLEEQSAEDACKALKRSGFSCFATRN